MKRGSFFPALFALVAILILWEAGVRIFAIPAYLLPTPLQIVQSLSPDLFQALFSTSLCAFLGFLLSTVVGILFALVLSASKSIERAFFPYFVFFQTVPIIAIAPLLVIWFGFGIPTVTASAFIVSIFPVLTNTLAGIRSTDIPLRELFSLYGATRWQTLWKLELPFALPQVFSGLRIAAGLAVIGAIVGEFIAGGGLGGIVDIARTQQRVDKVFAAVFLGSLLGLILIKLIDIVAYITLRNWHASAKED